MKAHRPDIDPARIGDIDAMWAALSSEGYIRLRVLIDSGAPVDKTLTLRSADAVES